MKRLLILLILMLLATSFLPTASAETPDTGQEYCYGESGGSIPCPEPGDPLFGQDGNYRGTQPSFVDNGDGTITDQNTGLMWAQDFSGKMTWQQALDGAEAFSLAGHDDWRMPTIKELFSLIDFSGITPMQTLQGAIPYVDTDTFMFEWGDESAGERLIDAQYWSSTEYVSTTMNGSYTVFGVNFADGRIKGYGTSNPRGGAMLQFVRYVRGGDGSYGVNDFVDNGDGTITDEATGLMWRQDDSGYETNWVEALAYCEAMDYAGFGDWRLPDAKELQYIVDYSQAPITDGAAAIDPIFNSTSITAEEGVQDFAFYWTSTTHLDGANLGSRAVYIAFGTAYGYMTLGNSDQYTLLDVHGAGAQRSDLKTGDPDSFPIGQGPQGDVQRIYNHARCVRGGDVEVVTGGDIDTRLDLVPDLGPPPDAGQGGSGGQNPGQGQPPGGGPPGGGDGQGPPGGGPPPGSGPGQ